MNSQALRKLFDQVRKKQLSPDEAVDRLRHLPFEDLGFAKIDHHRALRQGMPEVIFSQGKTPKQVAAIFSSLAQHGSNVLATRATEEQYAAVELLRGTMVRHSAAVYRNERPDHQPVSFHGDAWLGYVPIRMSDAICVQDRLPAGAAAVLINQTHTYRDLFFPIGSAEKRLFDAIDGVRSIHDIVETMMSFAPKRTSLEMARSFFERLWWHDQVVFDASR